MVILAMFEALLGALRTYLFSDTTNRIDMGLASQVIDRLVRLPMSYFGTRTTGELATRVQELQNIRSFLTGTALTVLLDVVFSVVYIGVMLFYSPTLTFAALSVVPLLIILTAVFSPILRKLLRQKAIRHAATQSYLDVDFSFAGNDRLQLKQVSVDIAAGSFVGIVGQSGSGKSTMMKLLPRFYQPQSGRILIDGYDIAKVELYSLRRQLGVVPQNPLLFEGTIHENIALNSPNADVEEIIEAAKIAAAHDFIMDLPEGYNTPVGERGSSLSGGQRQRIAIARAVLQNPRLLILDEATSALDYETEQQVCRNLAQRFAGRTVFFITHRLSTIRDADLILMMANGVIEERGTHQELMALQGRYSCLYQSI